MAGLLNAQRALGEYYGYPSCCVEEWVAKHPMPFFLRPEVQKKAALEGFVPCLKHSEQIVKGEVQVEDLIQNRICRLPFPGQTNEAEVDAYLLKYAQDKLQQL